MKRKAIYIEVRDDRINSEYKKLANQIKKMGISLWSVLPQILLEGMRKFIRETKNERDNN